MILVLVVLFAGFGAKVHTMHEINNKCKSTSEVSAMCTEVSKSQFVVAGTNKTPLGVDE